jgi:hypothetical protein
MSMMFRRNHFVSAKSFRLDISFRVLEVAIMAVPMCLRIDQVDPLPQGPISLLFVVWFYHFFAEGGAWLAIDVISIGYTQSDLALIFDWRHLIYFEGAHFLKISGFLGQFHKLFLTGYILSRSVLKILYKWGRGAPNLTSPTSSPMRFWRFISVKYANTPSIWSAAGRFLQKRTTRIRMIMYLGCKRSHCLRLSMFGAAGHTLWYR